MLHSLRFRLFLTLIVVVLVAVGTVGLLTSQATMIEFQRYVENDADRNQLLIDSLLAYYNQNRTPQELQAMVAQAATAYNQRIILVGRDGIVIADSKHDLIGQHLDTEKPIPAMVIALEPLPIFGAPIAGPSDGLGQQNILQWQNQDHIGPTEVSFIQTVNRSLGLAGALAVFVALLLTAALSRRILGPIETLTAAVRKMEKGDLTQYVDVRSNDEIGELAHAFNAMANGLARLEQLRRHMVTDAAHELRTPLTNIRGYLEAARDGVIQLRQPLIDSLYEEAMLLNRLVDDLQDIALAEAGQLRLVPQPVAPSEIIDKAVSGFLPLMADKGLTLTVDAPADLPMVEADSERIGQVLRNLLNNAIFHTPQGGAISIRAERADSAISFSVRDTGSGIAAEDLLMIFERFFRADRSRARATGGAGLGLTIAKQLVEAHGGSIWAESTIGAGSLFIFILPLSQSYGIPPPVQPSDESVANAGTRA